MNVQKPTILVVEDNTFELGKFERTFRESATDFPDSHRVPGFLVESAQWGSEAEKMLRQAHRKNTPYDLLVLDLELPREQRGIAHVEVGFEILAHVKRDWPRACGAVAIVSNYKDVSNLRQALQEGADDYIPKAPDTEEIFRSCVSAYLKGVQRRWAAVRQQRMESLLLELCRAQVADAMARTVSDGVNVVLTRVDELGRLLQDWHLFNSQKERDKPIRTSMDRVQDAAIEITRACANMRSNWHGKDEMIEEEPIAQTMEEVFAELRAGLLNYNLGFQLDVTYHEPIQTFRHDFKVMMRELLFGALEATGEEGDRDADSYGITVSVHHNVSDQTVDIVIMDGAAPVSSELLKKLAQDMPVDFLPKGDEIKTRWNRGVGLSFAQQLARGLGGRLTIKPAAVGKGNTITVQLPSLP